MLLRLRRESCPSPFDLGMQWECDAAGCKIMRLSAVRSWAALRPAQEALCPLRLNRLAGASCLPLLGTGCTVQRGTLPSLAITSLQKQPTQFNLGANKSCRLGGGRQLSGEIGRENSPPHGLGTRRG